MKKTEYKFITILIIAIILILSTTIISKQLNNLDEVWNYNLSRNFAENKVAYKDFNIVQMPLFFMITSLFLRICNELIVTRILAIILCTAILFCTYKILRMLKINKHVSGFAILIITYIYIEYFCLDYNFFNLLLILILMLLELIYNHFKEENRNVIKIDFLIGVIAGCSFLVKQTTGAFVIISTILIKLLYIRKNNFKNIVKHIFVRMIGICIPVALFALYLTINNAWHDFIDYTILGIFTFDNKKSYLELLVSKNIWIKTLSIVIPAYFAGMAITCIWKKDKNILVFLLYSMASFIVVYPISDNIHFLIGALPAIIGIIYVVYTSLKKYCTNHVKEKIIIFVKYMLQSMFYIIIVSIVIIKTIELIQIIKTNSNYKELEHFNYIPVTERLLNQIQNVDSYIESSEKPVYILDATAALYMIPINKYNKDYDMFLKGNIGGKGEEGQIEKLKNMDDVYILIMKNAKNRNWQTPTKVMEYIENNMEKVDEIEIFYVYE